MPRTVLAASWLAFSALTGSCASNPPTRVPLADDVCRPLCAYEGQPPAERALLRLLEMYVGPMDLVNASGSAGIGLLYDDQPETWQAMVVEVELVRDTMVGKLSACTPQNFTTIVAWHELPERSGVTGIRAWTPRLGATVPLQGPGPSGCWFRRPSAAGGWLSRVVDGQVFPKNLYHAMSGELAIDRSARPTGKPCPTPTPMWTWVPSVSCQRLTYNASMSGGVFRVAHAAGGEDSLPPRSMEFMASNIPGIRLVIDCLDQGTSIAFMFCR